MKKFTIILALALSFALTGCKDDNYVSVRHPENSDAIESVEEEAKTDEENTEEVDEIEDKNEEDVTEKVKKEIVDGVEVKVEDTVNMRLAPSQDSSIVAEVGPDDEILNLGETEGWTRVTVNGKTGYIRSDLLIKK